MSLKTISNTSCGVLYKDVDYKFIGMNSIEITDPVTMNLTRGADSKDSQGIVYKSGAADPIVIVATLKMHSDLFNVLNEAQKKGERMDFYAINDTDGSRSTLTDCILQSPIRQLSIDDTPDSLIYTLTFAGFTLVEK